MLILRPPSPHILLDSVWTNECVSTSVVSFCRRQKSFDDASGIARSNGLACLRKPAKEPLIKSEVPPAMNGQPAERSRKRSMSRNRVRTCAGLDVGWQVEDGLVQTFLRRPRARPVRGRYARGRRERGSPAPTGPRVVPGPMPWRDNRPATAPRIPSGTASSGGLRSAHEVHWRCSAPGCRRQRPRSRRNHALQSLMDGVPDARSARPSTPSTSRSAAPGPCSRNSEGSTSSSSSTTGATSESRTRSTRA